MHIKKTFRLLICLGFISGIFEIQPAVADDQPVYKGKGEIAKLLNQWYLEGTAAGNKGDWYDNRDRKHSTISVGLYPQLKVHSYTEDEKKARTDWGFQSRLLPKVVFGNSSTAGTVQAGGSLARHVYNTQANGLNFLYGQYRSNNLYIYPEHRDHDPGNNGLNGHGDLFSTNSPYLISSQGSSSSDKPFLNAFIQTSAAFHPDVKEFLVHSRVLMPTLQAIFRQSNKAVQQPGDYLTGAAHPTVFKGKNIDALKMIHMAHDMRKKTIPPLVELVVIDDDILQHKNNYLDKKRKEVHAETPAAIARIFRRADSKMRLTVSAEQSKEIFNRKLKFHWVVLRGDPSSVKIKERLDGSVAEITVTHPSRRQVTLNSRLLSNRIDIGVFASHGDVYSTPAFITVYGLDNERRIHDNLGRLHSIHYQAQHQLNFPDTKDIERWHNLFKLFEKKQGTQSLWLVLSQLSPEVFGEVKKLTPKINDIHRKYMQSKKKADSTEDKDEKKKAKQRLKKLQEEQKRLLYQESPSTGRGYVFLIQDAISQLALDPNFYLMHRKQIDKSLSKQHNNRRSQFNKERSKMVTFGYYDHKVPILSDDQYKLPARFPTNATFSNSAYQDFHAVAIGTALIPGFFKYNAKPNYVDKLLATSKPWRDVFQYDATGKRTGWIRYDAKGKKTFTREEYTE